MSLKKSVVCPVLIGRADELEVLDRLMEQMDQRRGQIALISGEAGLGKSRLVSEAVRSAGERGARVLKGNCFETDRTLPYAPLLDLLRSLASGQSSQEASSPFTSIPGELVKILPELSASTHDLSSTPMLEPEQEKHRLFQALTNFLVGQADRALVVVIEDLHWSDDTSLEFLLHFARRLGDRPILVLLTYRSEEVNPSLRHFLAELDRERLTTELVLARLSPIQVDSMLRAIFELERPVRAEFMDVLYSLTEGNPFFIEEILKSMIMAGEIFYADGTWDRKPIDELNIPRSIHDAVHRRAQRLSAGAGALLTTAAVVGQRFDFSLLQDLTGQDEHDLLPLIKELMAVQLIVEESGERFMFRHALTREAVYSQLLARERIALHQRIGESIERRVAGPPDPQIAGLAYHFYQAEVWQKAMEYSLRAGEIAQTLYAPRAAVEHLTHAVESARRLSLSPAPSAYRARGSANERLGDFERARADYEAALQAAHSIQEYRTEWRCLLDLGALWAGRDYSETGTYYQRAYELARQINDPGLLAHTLNRLGNWNVNVENPEAGLRYHHQALELFRELDQAEGLAETFDLLGMANYIHGDLVESESHYQQAVEIFRRLDYREGLASSLASMLLNSGYLQSGMAVLAKTDRANAVRACEEALKISRDIGWRSGEAYALIILGNYLGLKGDYATAFDLLKSSLAIAEEIEHRQWIVYSRYCLGILFLDILDLRQAREHLESALALANKIGSQWWVTNITGILALVYIQQKNREGASAALEAALGVSIEAFLREGNEIHALTLGQRSCWYASARLALAHNEPDFALRIADGLISSSANVPEGVIGRLWLLRGEALAAPGRFAEAEAMLLAARKNAEGEEERPLLWRIDISLGKLYQAQSRREEASRIYNEAQGIVGELAAKISDGAARDGFLKAALAALPRSRPLTHGQSAKKEFGGLTARERQVAEMVAEGKTNRELAEALTVSERTIETHVGNILSKLDYSSRAQIAAWVVEKGLLQGKRT